MSLDAYESVLHASSTLKLRATRFLAEGVDPFEAAVLFHEAARAERRSLLALEAPSAETRLAVAIEACFCLIDGLDPHEAALSWGDVLKASERVEPAVVAAMRSRLEPRYHGLVREFRKALRRCPTLYRLDPRTGFAPPRGEQRQTWGRELAMLLERFPGSGSFWWAKYRLAETSGAHKEAWDALQRARRLEPENDRFTAMSLLQAVKALRLSEVDRQLEAVYARRADASAVVCLFYALAELGLARKSRSEERWHRAKEAATEGAQRPTTDRVFRQLRAVQMMTDELLAGREPTEDVLYRAGLGDMVASDLASKRAPAELLQAHATQEVLTAQAA